MALQGLENVPNGKTEIHSKCINKSAIDELTNT